MVGTELMALNARADARRFWPDIHFCDRAAGILTDLLHVDSKVRFNPADERRYLVANQWLDQQCLAFFEQFPKGVGIECGAGLSTRFHRLCEQHEWPQFYWVDIDSEEKITLKSHAMPVIDNCRLVSSKGLVDGPGMGSLWNGLVPLIVVIDGLSCTMDMRWIEQFLHGLHVLRLGNTPIQLHVVYKVKTRWYEAIRQWLGLPPIASWQSVFTPWEPDISSIHYFDKATKLGNKCVVGLSAVV